MRLHVLLVDDDDATLFVCRLEGGRADYDLIVSDYKMGPTNGIAVLRAAERLAPKARRVLMSGYITEHVVRDAQEDAHIHEFVEKPMDYADFEPILRGIVERTLTARDRPAAPA